MRSSSLRILSLSSRAPVPCRKEDRFPSDRTLFERFQNLGVAVRVNKSEVREFFDGFLAHVPWVRAVSIEGQEGIKLQLATPWNQLPKGTKVTVKTPRKKL